MPKSSPIMCAPSFSQNFPRYESSFSSPSLKSFAIGASLTWLKWRQYQHFRKPFHDNSQWRHVDRIVWVEAIPPISVDDDATFDGVFFRLVGAVDAPTDTTVGAIVGSSKALNLATPLDEPFLHAFSRRKTFERYRCEGGKWLGPFFFLGQLRLASARGSQDETVVVPVRNWTSVPAFTNLGKMECSC